MDPMTSLALSGLAGTALGAAGGEVVKKATGQAYDAVTLKVRQHWPFAKEKADDRNGVFRATFGETMHRKVASGRLLESDVEKTLTEPSFYDQLGEAIKAAERTDDEVVYGLLADLLTDSMSQPQTSSFTMSLKIAVDAIGRLNRQHILLCALMQAADGIRPDEADLEGLAEPRMLTWFERSFSHFVEMDVKHYEVSHLMAAQCAALLVGAHDSFSFQTPTPVSRLSPMDPTAVLEVHMSPVYSRVDDLMRGPIAHHILTPAGVVVGGYAFAYLNKTQPNWGDWH